MFPVSYLANRMPYRERKNFRNELRYVQSDEPLFTVVAAHFRVVVAPYRLKAHT
jgi:hypothetical protein